MYKKTGIETQIFIRDKNAAPNNSPLINARFLFSDSYNANDKKNAEETCPKYQEEPVADKNQIMFPKAAKRPVQTISFLSFLMLHEVSIISATMPAPKA